MTLSLGDLDPTLTMDLTTMNPPGTTEELSLSTSQNEIEHSMAEEDEGGELVPTGKEAESEPLKMDTEPERPPPGTDESTELDNDTLLAAAKKAEGLDAPDEDEGDNNTASSEDEDTSSPITSSPTKSLDDPTTPSPVYNEIITTPAPVEPFTSPSPTQKPTFTYVDTDDALDPLANEKATEKEAFANGEAIPQTDDDDEEEDDDESNPATGPTTSWDDNDDGLSSSTMQNMPYDEEEVKKVGGGLTLAALILMIFTAYQMSENPDGVCASLCRLIITVIGCIIKVMLIPFKYIVGGVRPAGGHYMATPAYNDPYGSRHMELT